MPADRTECGSALIEALIAIAAVVAVISGVAFLLVHSTRAVSLAGTESMAAAIAQQKLEQLMALEWRFDPSGARRTDRTTDLSVDPSGNAGTGLLPSPGGSLDRDVAGFVDVVGADGRARPRSADPPPGNLLLRRWSIAAYPGDPEDTIVLTVLVLTPGTGGSPLARLQTLRTRTLR